MGLSVITELAENVLEAKLESLPMLKAFAKPVPTDGMNYYGLGTIINVDAYGAATTGGEYNASTNNFETSSGNTLSSKSVTLSKKIIVPQTFSMDDMEKASMGKVSKILANKMCSDITDIVGALLLTATFTNTTHEVTDNTTFDRGDLVTLNEMAVDAKWADKICVLNNRLYSNLGLDSVLGDLSKLGSAEVIKSGIVPNIAGFDNIIRWIGMPANTTNLVAGFITDGNAIGFASALNTPNYAPNIEWADAIDPETGICVRITRQQIGGTHDWNVVAQTLIGTAVLDATRLTLVQDTTT